MWVLPLDGNRKPYPVLSPDGRWLAYLSNESGTPQIYVVGFNGRHGKWQVSANGGQYPLWSQDGKELFYSYSGNSIYAVPVKEVAGALQFGGTHEAIVSGWAAPNPWFQGSPDGKKILIYRVSQDVIDSLRWLRISPLRCKNKQSSKLA